MTGRHHARRGVDIVAGADYLPETVKNNGYFSALTGKEDAWFERMTGIRERRRAAEDENSNTMALEAVKRMLADGTTTLDGVDLIVAASYTPWDTVATLAHVVQRHFRLSGARAIYLSTACSSMLNAIELVVAYMETGRAKRALVVAAEHNSLYARDSDAHSGHLWGDGAVALLLDAEASGGFEVVDVVTRGLADVGKGPEAVFLTPHRDGLVMPAGKDVFQHACQHMESAIHAMLDTHGLSVSDLTLLVPHQANDRIISQVGQRLGIDNDRVARTVGWTGNTGCASAGITLMRHRHLLAPGQLALLVTFGGGYSMGCALLRDRGAGIGALRANEEAALRLAAPVCAVA
ncbi:ketoacyl-ACP synthase III [Luteimonas sp. TWI1416]|uniref:3-oxoacyl-ACP synthase III family protein n=1 Tax=unclassified Luteimonas TaxID=2629088 RepID=UPI00320858DF